MCHTTDRTGKCENVNVKGSEGIQVKEKHLLTVKRPPHSTRLDRELNTYLRNISIWLTGYLCDSVWDILHWCWLGGVVEGGCGISGSFGDLMCPSFR